MNNFGLENYFFLLLRLFEVFMHDTIMFKGTLKHVRKFSRYQNLQHLFNIKTIITNIKNSKFYIYKSFVKIKKIEILP